jgi:methionyl-tRNA formyltransferase
MSKIALLVVGIISLASAAFCQEEKPKPDSYTFVAVSTGGPSGGASASFDFRINRYTTDEEVQQLANILKSQGQDGLRRAMEKLDVGRINRVGTTGTQIAVARKRQEGDKTIITIVTPRNMSFAELYNSGRSVDYPFGFLQVTLNDKGEGTGKIMAATKIRFDKKKDKIELESFGNQYIKAANVRPNK